MKLQLLIAIITNECQMRSMDYEDIELACKSTDAHYSEGNTFVASINFGIQLAEPLTQA